MIASPHHPLSGSISGQLTARGHSLHQRVYYEDTDFSGAVYHARYLHFMERGRTDYLRCLGIGQAAMAGQEGGLFFVVSRMEIDFKAQARMDDILTISTRTLKAHGAKMILDQQIHQGEKLLITAQVIIAVIDAGGRPRRLPQALTEGMAQGLDKAISP